MRNRLRGCMLTRLALLLALATALPARADCTCALTPTGDCAGPATCSADTFNALAHDDEQAVHDRDVCRAANDALSKELAARLVRVQALESAPPESVWPWVAAGAGGLLVGIVLGLVLH